MDRSIDILALTFEQFAQRLNTDFGKGDYHARALYRAIYKQGARSFSTLEELKKSGTFAEEFASVLIFPILEIESVVQNEVTKFTTRLHDSTVIESVIIPMNDYSTLCISSQVGCRMGCSFCKTGDMGFTRNLSVSEIVGQILLARHHFKADIRNIVFMGMGEPLDNLDNVIQSLKIITEQHGFDIPYKRITVSTSGLVEGIRELIRRDMTQVSLAISLNGAEDRLRRSIMPITNKFPIAELKQVLTEYPLDKKGVFFIEYVLLRGVNDSEEDALRIVEFCENIPVVVNLIPYNGETYTRPELADIERFRALLVDKKIFVRVRTARGDDISAACGQLAAQG